MKSLILKSSIAAVLLATSIQVSAEVAGNFGVTSTYLWRGVSLSANAPAVSGGIDYSNDSGIYAGIWQSSEGAAGSTETDFYAGFAGEAGSIGYDVGFISYKYLQNDTANFEEAYLNVSSGDFGAGVWIDSKNKNSYLTANAAFGKTTITIGSVKLDAGTDYTHFDVAYDLGDNVAFTFSKSDVAGDNGRFVVSWSKDLDMK